MLKNFIKLSNYDNKIWKILKKEKIRQEKNINLIASENYASINVMKIQGSILTNKYAEGYPKKRYYQGCKYIDILEEIAIKRAKKLFNSDYANVQPHSGSQANMSVYMALLKPNDTILGMNLSHGGHLTHGSSMNFSGKTYNFIHYGVNNNGNIDYENILFLTKKYNPKMIVGGFSSYSGLIDWSKLRKIANKVNAYLLVDMSHIAGLVAAGIYPNPLKHAHIVTTTTHKTLSGPRGGLILSNQKDNIFYKKINSSVFPGIQGGPLMHTIAAKAVAFKEAMDPKFRIYQKNVIKNAKYMVKVFKKRKFKIVSNKTNNHLFLIDLSNKNITGNKASILLELANIIVNKNIIPNDTKNSFITSGIRIGTPAITRRGLGYKDSKKIAEYICDILENIKDNYIIKNIKNKILKICYKYPIYKKIF
ncbi:serine hydroxymethyltransferase [Sodalis-like secondary symbiont of Drepanosiphum platanoidis]|uniref:serine hydroxymethyltransferase n=1 Tax=Sodalis-like secondary symbiont of Drepanosiphum platanoidis TaxID=2994493 RepID=UPI003463AED2